MANPKCKPSASVQCACGCGLERPSHDAAGTPRRFIYRHNPRPGRCPEHWKANAVSMFTGYARSKALIKTMKNCTWLHVGHCKGPLQRAHIDHNPLRNVESNVIVLCARHHRLYDRGRIDLKNPIMPSFYVDSGGKARYRPRDSEWRCANCGKVFIRPLNGHRYRFCSLDCFQKLRAAVLQDACGDEQRKVRGSHA
jgi:hypothetical protein